MGIVVDAESGEPLAATFVRLLEPHRSESTHADGEFGVQGLHAGRYTLVAERIGYKSVRRNVDVRAGQTTTLRLEMQPAALQLGQLIVTGTVGARTGREVLSPTAVVSAAELERKLDNTVAATLEAEPGVAVSSVGPATARPVIRGLGGDRILVLEDGQRPGDMSSTSGDHAVAVEALTARRFEVVRGPMSLLYGSSALGGVVNVVRDEIPTEVHEELHGTFSAQGESVNRGGAAGGFATFGSGALAARVEASGRNAGEVHTPAGLLHNTETRTYGASAGAAYVGDHGHLGMSYRFYDNRYGIPGEEEEEEQAGADEDEHAHEGGVDVDMRRHTLRLGAEFHRDDALLSALQFDAGFTKYNHVEIEGPGEEHEGETEEEHAEHAEGTSFDQDMLYADVSARHDTHGILAQGALGMRAQYRDIMTGGSLSTPSTYDYTVAGYAVEEIGTGAWRAQVGARWDWARYVPRDTTAFIDVGGRRIPVRERSFGSMSGALGLLYLASEELQIGSSISRAYRTPDFNELYSNGPHLAAHSFDVGDPELGEETGIGIDAFARYTGESLAGEVAVFRNRLDDYVFPSSRGRAEVGSGSDRPRFQYTNQDAVFTGAEGDLELSLSRRMVLSATASYVRAEFTDMRDSIPVFGENDTTFIAASKYPPLIPPLNGQVGLRYERRRYFAAADVRWAARQERLGDFEEPTEQYAVANTSVGVRIDHQGRFHTITLRVDNVLNTEYRNHLSRVKAFMPEPGRNLSLLYRVTF